MLIKEITDKEINAAITRLKPRKIPGTDGFTCEWYKTYKDELTPKLKAVCNWVLKGGDIPPSWKEATITVIPKEGKDKLSCSQYRPISVLNLDYKIFMSIIAKRLDNIIHKLIDLDQTGFIRQRQTQDSIRRTLHVIHHIKKKQYRGNIDGSRC